MKEWLAWWWGTGVYSTCCGGWKSPSALLYAARVSSLLSRRWCLPGATSSACSWWRSWLLAGTFSLLVDTGANWAGLCVGRVSQWTGRIWYRLFYATNQLYFCPISFRHKIQNPLCVCVLWRTTTCIFNISLKDKAWVAHELFYARLKCRHFPEQAYMLAK